MFRALVTTADSDQLERVQSQALKVIYGWQHSYASLLEVSGLERLEARRERDFLNLAIKMSSSPRFSSWFPVREMRNQPRSIIAMRDTSYTRPRLLVIYICL